VVMFTPSGIVYSFSLRESVRPYPAEGRNHPVSPPVWSGSDDHEYRPESFSLRPVSALADTCKGVKIFMQLSGSLNR